MVKHLRHQKEKDLTVIQKDFLAMMMVRNPTFMTDIAPIAAASCAAPTAEAPIVTPTVTSEVSTAPATKVSQTPQIERIIGAIAAPAASAIHTMKLSDFAIVRRAGVVSE